MPLFEIVAEIRGREVYVVDALNENIARLMVYNGDAGEPSISEVLDVDITDISIFAAE